MSDLLKEAIADAKAVRETALQNAKMALEEAFTPHLKSMLSAKLAEEDIEEDENPFADKDEDDEEESADEGMHDSPRREDDDEEVEEAEHDDEDEDKDEVDESEIVEIDGVKYAPIVTEDEHEDEEDEMDESEELDLEAVIKELEEELNETESDDDDEEKVDEEVVTEAEHEDEDEDKDEVDEQSTSSGIGSGTGVKQPSAGDEEDPGKGKVHEQVNTLQSELNEYKEAVVFLKDKLHEVNILNAKLLYTNKLFKEFVLSNDQKLKIVETFDRAQTSREIKLVYSTLAESYTDNGKEKKEVVKEFASKKSGGTAPSKKIISEENQVADRFRKLAGLIKS